MEITIKDKKYKLKYTLRALFIFEQITGKVFSVKNLTDEYIFFYCLLMANNKEMNLTFDDLIDAMDEDPAIMRNYQTYMAEEMTRQNQFKTEAAEKNSKKKV